MNIQILHSWLLEYLDTEAPPEKIAESLALCGPSVETVSVTEASQPKTSDELTMESTPAKKDWLYDIEVTTNRVDLMSVIGIAREAATILPRFGYKATFKPLYPQNAMNVKSPALPLHIKTDETLTNRVMAVVMEGFTVQDSPKWLKDRLEAAGIRSLNNIIDITNYVMLEVGHPTHVFDYDRISTHTLVFRTSKKGEKLTTLDKKTFKLPGDDIVVENGEGEIVDLPGIMGTDNSVVTNKTEKIIFFINNNDPVLMRKTSMTLGIRTVAVTLNEKKVDPELAKTAMLRAIELYSNLYGAKLASPIQDFYTKKPQPTSNSISRQFIEERLGLPLKSEFITSTLTHLGFTVKETSKTSGQEEYMVTSPTWRVNDISIPEDIIEEIARIYGYHNLPSIIPQQQPPVASPQKDQFSWESLIKHTLKNWGYKETYTYSLISKEEVEKFLLKPESHYQLRNPLSTEWLYLRQSLIPTLLRVVQQNQDREEENRFFEMANVYLSKDKDFTVHLPVEQLRLAIAQTDDFFALKGSLEALCEELGIELTISPTQTQKYLDPMVQAEVLIISHLDPVTLKPTLATHSINLGYIGLLSNDMQASFGIHKPVALAEIDVQKLAFYATKNKKYTPIPKYPPVLEHLTFFNEKQVPASNILTEAKRAHDLVHEVKIIGAFEKKLTLEVTYLDRNRNLTNEEIAPARKLVVGKLENVGLTLQGTV